MPLPKELRSLLKSDIADLINSKLGNPTGSMLVGGHFLREFIGFKAKSSTELIDWAHLDIAGPANNEGAPYGYTPKGATGVMIRTLVELAKAL
jgi:leucyl aminopeptidase